jgi:hypothetical protein
MNSFYSEEELRQIGFKFGGGGDSSKPQSQYLQP